MPQTAAKFIVDAHLMPNIAYFPSSQRPDNLSRGMSAFDVALARRKLLPSGGLGV